MSELYAVEINGDGDAGYPHNVVAEIGICRVDLGSEDFDTVYHDVVRLDPLDIGKASLDWISAASGMDARELYFGSPAVEIAAHVRDVLAGGDVACFDIGEVFGKYLLYGPWDLTHEVSVMPSVSLRIPRNAIPVQGTMLNDRIRYAYSVLCPGDPAGVGKGRRALHLAQMTSEIIIMLRSHGLY
ncbi:MAG: hypothetical protein EOM93_01300 [Gammaproteobacteria bacterium]|nr:hypothetical protein [Gammaproteobacteria bacterium]